MFIKKVTRHNTANLFNKQVVSYFLFNNTTRNMTNLSNMNMTHRKQI